MLKRFLFILLVQFIYCQDCILEVPDDPLNLGTFQQKKVPILLVLN